MSWKRYFTPVEGDAGSKSPLSIGQGTQPGPARSNYSSFLPDVYTGAPNRVERYGQYNVMDQDSEVNAALDILAEFCSQQNPINKTSFSIECKYPKIVYIKEGVNGFRIKGSNSFNNRRF